MATLQAFYLRPQPEWRGGNVHKDDILTTAYCPPNLLATASFDGEIIVWSTGRQMLKQILCNVGSFAKLLSCGLVAPSQSYCNILIDS